MEIASLERFGETVKVDGGLGGRSAGGSDSEMLPGLMDSGAFDVNSSQLKLLTS
jgi:hypothetical protein